MSLAIHWPWSHTGKDGGEDPAAYLDDVYRYARPRLRSREDAEDLACEVVQSLPTPWRRADLRGYMMGIARRKVADRLRRTRPTVEIRDPDLAERFDDASDNVAVVELVLAKLTADQREALTLKYVVGLSSEEVGAALGRSSEAIDSLLQRGRAAFAREWNALSSEEECVSRDGTVWVATKMGRDSGPDEFWGVPGVHYTGGSGIVFEGKLSRKDNITVYGFTPLDKPTSLPTNCSMSIRQFTPSVPIPNSDSVTAGRVLGVVGKLTFPVRVEPTYLPSYAASFGAEDGLLGVQFNKQDAKAQAYESSHRYAEAARMYELIGIDCTPAYHAYLEWMQHASECYRNAGLTADALRVDAAMSRYRSTARP